MSVFVDLILFLLVVVTFLLFITLVPHLFIRVPYVPTPMGVVDEMIRLADLKGNETVFDLGAGDGRFLSAVLKKYPHVHAIGCEAVPVVWMLGILRKWWMHTPYTLHLSGLMKEDVRSANAVFLYLIPEVMAKLKVKFDRELKPGTVVISSTFRFPGKKEESAHKAPGFFGQPVSFFVYRW